MPALKVAFMALVGGADPKLQHAVLTVNDVEVKTVLVGSVDQAVSTAKQLAADGYRFIELCGGFGHLGCAKVVEAVKGTAEVGVVRFDFHPAFGRSADDIG
ncbi:MAG: hypothetical protein H5U01_07905 [Clostridia bacterium]|nr:hypothetical protein [Clostridia bacterium]MBC7347184.1 hypothetical protein [Clostridia bacterium]